MLRALAFKELRETWWLGGIAFLILTVQIAVLMGLNADLETFRIYWMQDEIPLYRHRIPFLENDLNATLIVTGIGLAVLLGFWQTIGESVRKTWACLLHRPLRRRTVMLVKLSTGLGLLLLGTGIPVLIYALWADTPGTHAGPFGWWMTMLTWRLWFCSSVFYLASFLCGIREARWWFSRLWPLVPVLFFPVVILEFPWFSPFGFRGLIITDAVLLGAILYSVRIRDFA